MGSERLARLCYDRATVATPVDRPRDGERVLNPWAIRAVGDPRRLPPQTGKAPTLLEADYGGPPKAATSKSAS